MRLLFVGDIVGGIGRRTLAVLALDRYGVTDLGWGDPMRWVAESPA